MHHLSQPRGPTSRDVSPCYLRAVSFIDSPADEAYHLLVEAAPDGVLVVDGDGRIVLANPELRRLTGFSAEDLIGQPIEMLVPPSNRKSVV